MKVMRKKGALTIYCLCLLLMLSCNIPSAINSQKMSPERFDTTGDRRSYSGEYSCDTRDKVILIIDADGVAMLTTTGPVFVDYINCVLDPSGFEATFTIVGLADPDLNQVDFTSCNDGAFSADGTISYQSGSPSGNVSCNHKGGSEAGKMEIYLWVPSK